VVYKDETQPYKGTASGDVESVTVFLNGEEVENLGLTNGAFSFEILFSDLGQQDLVLKGNNGVGEVVAEAQYQPVVRERGSSDSDDMFDFSFPKFQGSVNSNLWATYYYLPQVTSIRNGHPLRDLSGNPLGPVLSKRDWCNSAMEGSVRVIGSNGEGITYNYAGTSSSNSVDCLSIFPRHPKTSQVKFRLARGSYGDGVKRYRLVPFRTIAVDNSVIPYGSIVYIPGARGNKIILPDGSETVHDGYFFAGDTGGAIKGTHIDVYIGVAKKNPFSWVKSNSSGTFKAKVVNDPVIKQVLTDLHLK
jgi:3D (Asp-Asp-Asp) domain-containing protein